MISFDELLDPITPEIFEAEYRDRKPLHIPAAADRRKAAILDWATFNGLLNRSSAWNANTLRLVRDGDPIAPSDYCMSVHNQSGTKLEPVPGKVEVLLSTGASIIANDIQDLTPAAAALAETLSRTFGAAVSANAYCSFGGVQAFGTHFDLHDVFAIHTEGEKVWRLYQNRADHPVDFPIDGPQVRDWFRQTRGALMQEVRMRPGDVLYLPRGWYHDALADADPGAASLHLTFSVTPLYGRIIFGLLEQAAMQNPLFRRSFAPGERNGGRDLRDHLAAMGQYLAELSRSSAFLEEVTMAQHKLVRRPPKYDLPRRKPLTIYHPTAMMPPAITGPARHAVEWAMSQPRFALEDMIAEFDMVPETALRDAVARLEAAGCLRRG